MVTTNRIEMNPKVMLGKPVIRDTRITVELILRKFAEGADGAAVLAAYPPLTQDDIQAALRYSADRLSHEATMAVSPHS